MDAEIVNAAKLKQRVKRWAPTLGSSEAEERLAAMLVLGTIGPESKAAIPALINLLSDQDPVLRTTAASALGAIGAEAIEAVPALIEVLKKDDDGFHPFAFEDALGKIGSANNAAVPLFIELLNDPSELVRVTLLNALGLIGVSAKAAIPVLKELLSDPNQQIRSAAEQTLKQIEADEHAINAADEREIQRKKFLRAMLDVPRK